jgi:Holliday junction resolvasome RuvABC endonuclease subunit
MPKELPRILAVNPGSRYIGFAAFRGPELLDWGVRVISAKTPQGRVRVGSQIVKEAIERFQPDTLAVKRLHSSRTSTCLDRLTDSIQKLARRRKLKLHQYSITALKYVLCSGAKGNKRQLAAEVAATYPVLSRDLQKEMANRNPYYLRMFEAVALGIVVTNDRSDRPKQLTAGWPPLSA